MLWKVTLTKFMMVIIAAQKQEIAMMQGWLKEKQATK